MFVILFMGKSKNIMLMGFSGSWKTTTADYFSKNFGYKQVIGSDTIHTKLRKSLPFIFKEWETDIDSTSYKLTQIVTKVIQLVDIAMKSRSNNGLVYDACNLQQSTRDKMWKILGDYILIEVTAEEKDLLARLEQRQNPEVWKDLYKKQKENYEKPENAAITFDTSTETFADFHEKLHKTWLF